jgi:hypothetical protein
MLRKIGGDKTFLDTLFSDGQHFHLDGIVNRANCRIQGNKPSQEIIEHQRDTPKVATVTDVMFVNTRNDIEYRFDVRVATNGTHIET